MGVYACQSHDRRPTRSPITASITRSTGSQRGTPRLLQSRRGLACHDVVDAPDPHQIRLRQPRRLGRTRSRPATDLHRGQRAGGQGPARRAGRQPGRAVPAIIRQRQNAFAEFVPFLSCSPEIRKVISTARAPSRTRTRFRRQAPLPNEWTAVKCLYHHQNPRRPRPRQSRLDHTLEDNTRRLGYGPRRKRA